MKPDERERVREPAKVHALVYLIKAPDLFVRNIPKLQVVKDVAAGADRESEVFVLIRPEVGFFQVLRFEKKLLSQPVFRGFEVC